MSALSWTGPRFGLANRLVSMSAAASVARILDRPLVFGWANDDECPADYNELFERSSDIAAISDRPIGDAELATGEWDPLLILQAAQRQTGRAIPMRAFLDEFLASLRSLPIQGTILDQAREWAIPTAGEHHVAIHIRRTDRMAHHRANFFQPYVRTRLRAFGRRSSLLYLLATDDVIRRVENWIVERRLRLASKDMPGKASYTIYADAPDELAQLEAQLRHRLGGDVHYRPSPVASSQRWISEEGMLRTTTVADAFVELLTMSHATSIIRNNRSSTFSLVPSFIGRAPLTPEPRHAFWREISRTFRAPPWDAPGI